MCGEKRCLILQSGYTSGSPPHVRGKVVFDDTHSQLPRITPACAGKSQLPDGNWNQNQDHPRMCGEKPSGRSKGSHPAQDHPRMCGEKALAGFDNAMPTGSPPHVRGKGCDFPGCVGAQGITPACAGKRFGFQYIKDFMGDHPRMCGEKALAGFDNAMPTGSPPHVRGKGCDFPGCVGAQGITPACAGKRFGFQYIKDFMGDHPRMCGEKEFWPSPPTGSTGSPPHVRGKAFARAALIVSSGITPACAGKSCFLLSFVHIYEDHPRMCGEKKDIQLRGEAE